MTDIRTEQIMQEENYKELSDMTGVNIMGKNVSGFEDNVLDITKANHPILGLINLARLKRQTSVQNIIFLIWKMIGTPLITSVKPL